MINLKDELMYDLEYLLTGAPSGPIKNFSKFQAISDLFTGDQVMNFGFPRLTPYNWKT